MLAPVVVVLLCTLIGLWVGAPVTGLILGTILAICLYVSLR